MKTRTIVIILFNMSGIASFGQERIDAVRLRNAALNSAVIIASNDFRMVSNHVNDHYTEQFYTVSSIDTIIKNTTQFKAADKIKIQQYGDDNSSYWSEYEISAAANEEVREVGVRYSNLFFLKKDGKQYKLLVIATSIKWDDLTGYYFPAISQAMEIGEIKNLNERYTKNIDWFIENNSYPDDGFIAFYTEKGIIRNKLSIITDEIGRAHV